MKKEPVYYSPVLACVACDGLELEFAASELQADRFVVQAACLENGLAIAFASAALQNDVEIVTIACRQNGLAIAHASEDLKSNKAMALLACDQNGCAYQHISRKLQSDPDVVLLATAQSRHVWASCADTVDLPQASTHLRKICQGRIISETTSLPYASLRHVMNAHFPRYLTTRLADRENYIRIVLCAIEFGDPDPSRTDTNEQSMESTKKSKIRRKAQASSGPSLGALRRGSLLPMLNIGHRGLVIHIADFLGMPYGRALFAVRRAQYHISRPRLCEECSVRLI